MEPYLETERLTLRRFTAEDADLLIELDSDPAVMRYLTGGKPTPPEEIRERYLPRILAGYQKWDGKLGLLAAHLKPAHERDPGAFIGWFILRPKPEGPLDEVELGYRLRQAAWGRGYATEGSRALLDKAFTELDVRLVWADTMFVNRGSRHVMEKLGMTHVDTYFPDFDDPIEGTEHGEVRYEITAEQWFSSRPAR
ncbi:MAG: GNAT family N-acetyltransferase [Catenulispora sp.]|nr:GNAT family N-acetyltransferase [Catenulispora sp.]